MSDVPVPPRRVDAPIFVDLQGFVVGDNFVLKEVAVLRNGRELIHHVFREAMPWTLLTKAEQARACWLTINHHDLRWSDGNVDYKYVKPLLRGALFDDAEDDSEDAPTLVYVKGSEKKKWLRRLVGGLTEDRNILIETIDVDIDYEDIERLGELDGKRAYTCGNHTRNCAMENVCKLYEWWSARGDRLRDLSF